MDKISECNKWVEFAEKDYEAVQLLVHNAKPLLEIICFHCQQCAEKYIKAFIIKTNNEIQKTHNLEELLKTCIKIDCDFISIKNQCIDLSDYAVETRYPYPYEIDLEDMKKAIQDLDTIRDFIVNKIIN